MWRELEDGGIGFRRDMVVIMWLNCRHTLVAQHESIREYANSNMFTCRGVAELL